MSQSEFASLNIFVSVSITGPIDYVSNGSVNYNSLHRKINHHRCTNLNNKVTSVYRGSHGIML